MHLAEQILQRGEDTTSGRGYSYDLLALSPNSSEGTKRKARQIRIKLDRLRDGFLFPPPHTQAPKQRRRGLQTERHGMQQTWTRRRKPIFISNRFHYGSYGTFSDSGTFMKHFLVSPCAHFDTEQEQPSFLTCPQSDRSNEYSASLSAPGICRRRKGGMGLPTRKLGMYVSNHHCTDAICFTIRQRNAINGATMYTNRQLYRNNEKRFQNQISN